MLNNFYFRCFFLLLCIYRIPDLRSQTQSLWSRDSIKYLNSIEIQASQYSTALFTRTNEFFNSDSIKRSNQYAAVHSWIVKDFNSDGYCDVFLSFFTGGEYENIPFKLYLYDSLNGIYIDKSYLIKNNSGQSFNRKAMAADLNGDKIPDIVAVSHPECNTCELSSFDILFSDKNSGTWTQQTKRTPNRLKGEGYFHGIAMGDIDNDGDIDIVLANENTFNEGNISMLNDGKGNFIEKYSMAFFDKNVSSYGISWTTELIDINQDGYLDLFYWHDAIYKGIAYGDGSGQFGNKAEQRFPKSTYDLIMDFDPLDIDKDGDLDLILTTTNYNQWELVFLENTGKDNSGKVIWKDRSNEINNMLIKNGFYKENGTKNWIPYLAVLDLNNDGFFDLLPQRPLNNYEGTWIIYGKGSWNFNYRSNSIPEKQIKPKIELLSTGKIKLSWKKISGGNQLSNTDLKEWKLYMNDKPFGDKSMVKTIPLLINSSTASISNDSVNFITNLPFDSTFLRISVIDSNNFETPLSDTSFFSCKLPLKPIVQNQSMCSNIINSNLSSFVSSTSSLQWYDSLNSSMPRISTPIFKNSIGTHNYYVSAINKCESYNKSILTISIIQTPDPPLINRDTANNLVTSMNGITWYKDGVKIADTTQKIKPTTNGIYTATTTQNGCTSALSQGYYYLTNAVANLSNGEYFKVSPNPTSGELNIHYKILSSRNISISVFDINGRAVLLNKKVESGSKVNLGSVSKGNYIIQVKDGAGRLISIQKLVKE